MTALSHLDPNFSTVAAIQAINGPIMDDNQTPGLGECKLSYTFYFHEMSRLLNE